MLYQPQSFTVLLGETDWAEIVCAPAAGVTHVVTLAAFVNRSSSDVRLTIATTIDPMLGGDPDTTFHLWGTSASGYSLGSGKQLRDDGIVLEPGMALVAKVAELIEDDADKIVCHVNVGTYRGVS